MYEIMVSHNGTWEYVTTFVTTLLSLLYNIQFALHSQIVVHSCEKNDFSLNLGIFLSSLS